MSRHPSRRYRYRRHDGPSAQAGSAPTWGFEQNDDRLSWRRRGALSVSGFQLCLLACAVVGFHFAVFAIVCLLTELLAISVMWLRDISYVPFSIWAEPGIWAVPALMSLIVLGLLSSNRSVDAFEFNLRQAVLVISESRWGKFRSRLAVPFSAIDSLTPCLLTSYATDGHFEVRFCSPRGRMVRKGLGDGIPLDVMNKQATWLAETLGDRVKATVRMDT